MTFLLDQSALNSQDMFKTRKEKSYLQSTTFYSGNSSISAPWMDSYGLHSYCDENKTCLPLGIKPSHRTEVDSTHITHASKIVQQI